MNKFILGAVFFLSACSSTEGTPIQTSTLPVATSTATPEPTLNPTQTLVPTPTITVTPTLGTLELPFLNPDTGVMETITGTVVEQSEYWGKEIEVKDIMSAEDRVIGERVSESDSSTASVHINSLVLRQSKVIEVMFRNGEISRYTIVDFGVKSTVGNEKVLRVKILHMTDTRIRQPIITFLKDKQLGGSYNIIVFYSLQGFPGSTSRSTERAYGLGVSHCPTENKCNLGLGRFGDLKLNRQILIDLFNDEDIDIVDLTESTFISYID